MDKGFCLIRPRDVDILAALETFRCLTLGQIWAAYFKGASHGFADHLLLSTNGRTYGSLNGAYHRLLKLARQGYVDRRIGGEWGQMFRLGPGGHRYLRSAGRSAFRKVPEWPAKDVRHTLLCGSLGLFFSKALGLEVTSERQLASRARLSAGEGRRPGTVSVPDLEVFDGEKRYRVELELSEKPAARYAALWKSMGVRVRDGATPALYVAGNEKLAERILRLADKGYFAGIYAVSLAGLRERWIKVRWKNFRGREFGFGSG